MSALDTRVHKSHRKLDGQKADKDGYYHFGKWKSIGPRLWGVTLMDIQCRCHSINLVNGKLPEYRRGKDYMDDRHQKKLAARIDAYMEGLGLTYKQAINKAYKEVKPPSVTIPLLLSCVS
jgi:hypothetical protein